VKTAQGESMYINNDLTQIHVHLIEKYVIYADHGKTALFFKDLFGTS